MLFTDDESTQTESNSPKVYIFVMFQRKDEVNQDAKGKSIKEPNYRYAGL